MPSIDTAVDTSKHAQILKRDRVVADLRRLARDHPEDARAADERLRDRIRSYIDKKNEEKRASVREELVVLDVARNLALDLLNRRRSMWRPSDLVFDPDALPDGVMLTGLRCLKKIGPKDHPKYQAPVWAQSLY